MKNHYLSLILLSFVPLAAMEQGALLPQKPALKAVPSLKEIALKAYAKHLHKNVPKSPLIVAWGEWHGLQKFFDLNLDRSVTIQALKHLLAQPRSDIDARSFSQGGPTRSLNPILFSPNGRYQLFQDEDEKRYVFYADERLCITHMTVVDEELLLDIVMRSPLFSPDGRWLFGWHRGSPKKQVLVRCGCGSSEARVLSIGPGEVDYTFLNADTIVLRTTREIFAAQLDDLFEHGKESLQKVYERTDDTDFYIPWNRYKTMHGVVGPRIVCVGPAEKNFEIFEPSPEGNFSLTKKIPFTSPSLTKKIIVHSERGIAARAVSGGLGRECDESIEIYQLFGDDAGFKSKIETKKFENHIFSPCGNYLACKPPSQGDIKFFDCSSLTTPKKILLASHTYGLYLYLPLKAWTDLGLIVDRGNRIIQFNAAAPLVAAYAAHREKQEREKATGKNA